MKNRNSVQSENESLTWLLNLVGDFPTQELQASNLHPMKTEQLNSLKQTDELLQGQIYSYSIERNEFTLQNFILMPNILICIQTNTGQQGLTSSSNQLLPPQAQFQQKLEQNANYLILSNCSITQKVLSYKQNQAFGMILTNSIGNTYLFFSQFSTHRTWYKQLKQYCKLTGFLEKYKLGEKLIPGFYQCIKKKNKTQYTVQIYKIDDFEQCSELEEAVHNEIHILRSIKHQNLLELKRVYENPKYMFIVYEYYKGESLFKIINQGIQMHEVQTASIIYQLLQLIKFLHQHQFYHGSINPQNILINTQHQMLQITMINLSFKEYKVNDKLDWILNRAVESFLAPEIFDGIAPNITTDLYSVGCLIYFLTFYNPQNFTVSNDERDFYTIMEQFQIDMNKVKEQEKILSKRYSQQNPQPTTISASQIELLKKLMEVDPNKRMTIKEATKHSWFVNIKSKIKSMKMERKRKKPLPSLRTIIELREQSEMDIRMTIIQQQQSGINNSRLAFTNNKRQSYLPKTPSQLKPVCSPNQSSQQNVPNTPSQFQISSQQNNQFQTEEDIVPDENLDLEVKALKIQFWKKQQLETGSFVSNKNNTNY